MYHFLIILLGMAYSIIIGHLLEEGKGHFSRAVASALLTGKHPADVLLPIPFFIPYDVMEPTIHQQHFEVLFLPADERFVGSLLI
jgi:hypothetical protein